jgi:hypothetical protein
MINKFTIFGERCSGTNYLEHIIKENFTIELTWNYGFKHFFGFSDFSNSDDTLFVCIIRNPCDWFNSLYINKHHLPIYMRNNEENFLNSEVFSMVDEQGDGKEVIKNDINIETKEKYKNIFELRHVKMKYLIETMPTKVKNYILIRYEDLLNDFEKTMNRFLQFQLEIKTSHFPYNNTKKDFKYGGKYKKNNNSLIHEESILKNKHFDDTYEKKAGYM